MTAATVVPADILHRRQLAVDVWKGRPPTDMRNWQTCALGQLARAGVGGWRFHRDYPVTAFQSTADFFRWMQAKIASKFRTQAPYIAAQQYFGIPLSVARDLFAPESDPKTIADRLMAAPYA